MGVAELNRLLDVFVGPRDVAGPPEDHQKPDETTDEEEKPCEAGLGEEIGAAIEDLGHRELCDSRPVVGRSVSWPASARA